MKTLIEYIKESYLFEGGHSVDGVEPIKGNLAKEVADAIIKQIEGEFKCKCAPLGSTGKKSASQTSGDIDIALELPWDKKDDVIKFVKETWGDMPFGNIVEYLHVFNIGYRYKDGDKDKLVQVDFMFVDDVEYAKFVYHSPNFLKNESQFKGSWRSTLLRGIVACAPVEKILKEYKTTYFTKDDYDGSYDGEIKSFWKFTFSQADGLVLDNKSYEGNKKPVKNPKVIKDNRKIITKDIDKILHMCLGPKCTKDDCTSYESLLAFMASDNYLFKSVEQLEKIKEWLFDNSDLLREASDEVQKTAKQLFDDTIKYIK